MTELAQTVKALFLSQFHYNTAVVIFGVIAYGVGTALIGNFLVLQKRSLLADVLSHATFPGIVFIFIAMLLIENIQQSRSRIVLILGASVSALIAVYVLLLIQKNTVLKIDAIQACVLSISFGIGIAALGIAQQMPVGSTAGMYTYMYGNTASMQLHDAYLFSLSSLLTIMFVIYYRRHLTLISFDSEYASTLTVRNSIVDFLSLIIVVLQVVIGIQAIGVLMVSAMFIIPAVIAKFWSEKLNTLLLISMITSVVCGYIGALISANSIYFPTGAIIILVMEVVFIGSLFFGTKRGLLVKYIRHTSFTKKVQIEHILRMIFELNEDTFQKQVRLKKSVDINVLIPHSGLSRVRFITLLRGMRKKGLIVLLADTLQLTDAGLEEVYRIVRNHRLWEEYLMNYAGATLDTVDYSADQVEHVLGRELTLWLEESIRSKVQGKTDKYGRYLFSPHPTNPGGNHSGKRKRTIL